MMHAVANVTAVRPTAGPRARPRAAAGARSATAAPAMKIQMGRRTKASGAARLGRRATRTFATEGEYPATPIALIVASSASARARLGAKREGAGCDALQTPPSPTDPNPALRETLKKKRSNVRPGTARESSLTA